MEINKENQIMIEKVKLAKAMNSDIYYKDFAEYINIDINSMYNWLQGKYNLSTKNIRKLEDVVIDLIT